MSEKVRLTKEQAKAVEVFKDNNLTLKDYAYENLSEELDPIQILGIDKMARALYVGYEIEPEFRVGDWVVRTVDLEEHYKSGVVFKIAKVDNGVLYDDRESVLLESTIRHATPEEIEEEKQRRWWAKHGRGVWELKEGDVLNLNGHTYYIVDQVDADGTYWLVSKDGPGTLTQEILIEEDTWEWRIVYFAEDRKDLDD